MRLIRRRKARGLLYVKLFAPDGGLITDYGLVSDKLVTDAYAQYYVDCLHGGETGIASFKYHDSGIGSTAEDETDEGLDLATGIARVVGSQGEGDDAITYRTVGLITYDGAYEVCEWGLFNAASAGVLMDRAVFTAVTVAADYQLEFTYDHVAVSGG